MAFLRTQFINQRFDNATFTDQNQLSSALLTTPELSDILVYAMAQHDKGYKYNVMQMLTQGTGRVRKPDSTYKVLGNNQVEWALMGNSFKTLVVTGQSTPAPAQQPGRNLSTFVVPLQTDYFSVGDVIRTPSGRLIRVMEPPYINGSSYCYKFQIMTNDVNDFIPPLDLVPGTEFAFSHTAFEEGSEGGGMKTATPMMFRNQMNIQRIGYGMTGGAKTDALLFKFKVGDGKTNNLWLYKMQYEALKYWSIIHERALWLNRYNRLANDQVLNVGENGRPILMGSGIEEQIMGTNFYSTPELTEDLLQHVLLDIMACNHYGAENQKRLLITGSGGIYEFNKAMRKAVGTVPAAVDTKGLFIHKKTGNQLGFGAQFVTYKGLMNTEFTVVYHPMFDDTTLFPQRVKGTGFTRKSYQMFALDFSDYGGEPNIQLATKGAESENRRLVQWFTAGATTPDFNGSSNVDKLIRSNGFDGFMCWMLSETMVIVRNPLSCAVIDINKSVDTV